MEFDLSKAKLRFTVREIVLLCTFIGGLTAHVIRTEVQNESLTKQVSEVQVELKECRDRLSLQRSGSKMFFNQ